MVDPVVERLQEALRDRYRFDREVGHGGMATVYRAQDLKHERPVAIKVLRPELAVALGPERFLQEIKFTAQLTHPHILPLLDSGEAAGFLYYVMPYVDGESLRERLNREEQLPIEAAVEIAREVANALDYAHQRDVVHRDIKPENILLEQGHAVVADFGIARAITAAGADRLTATGMAVGTPEYMSPEQAAGRQELDGRSDLYALGCVLYEMLAGKPPHTGNVAQAIIAQVLTQRPRLISELRPSVPANVEAALETSLAKLAADRFTTVGEFARALANPAFALRRAPGPSAAAVSNNGLRWFAILMSGLAAVLAVLLTREMVRPEREPSVPAARFQIIPPEGYELVIGGRAAVAVSPDGHVVAFLAYNRLAVGASTHPDAVGRETQLFVRSLNELEAHPLNGTTDARQPFFSPDGQWLGFWQDGAIRKVALAGGLPTPIADVATMRGASWEPSNSILFGGSSGLARVPAEGGRPMPLASQDSGVRLQEPDILPGGKTALVEVRPADPSLIGDRAAAAAEIGVVALETGEVKLLGLMGNRPRYLPGFILYTRGDGWLFAVPFDAERRAMTGHPLPLIRGGAFAVSPTGVMAYVRTSVTDSSQLEWVTRNGSNVPVDRRLAGGFGSPTVSPGATQLAFHMSEQTLWVKSLREGSSTLLARGPLVFRPNWTPDGGSVVFVQGSDLYRRRADAASPAELLLDYARPIVEGTWSSSADWLVFRTDNNVPGQGDILAMRLSGDTAALELVATAAEEVSPTLSRNGRWMAYVSDESGQREVYVRPFPRVADSKWQVSRGGGVEPVWAHSGHELFYRNAANEMVAASVTTEPTFSVEGHRVLFSTAGYKRDGLHPDYDVAPGDQRFIMIRDRRVYAAELILTQRIMDELTVRSVR